MQHRQGTILSDKNINRVNFYWNQEEYIFKCAGKKHFLIKEPYDHYDQIAQN
jgi:hypothetical protein